MPAFLRTLQRVAQDLLAFRNMDAYVVTAIAIALIALDILGDVPVSLQLTVIIAALAVLVFRATAPPQQIVDLDAVLHDRQGFGAFHDTIRGAQALWVYGPSAVNILRQSSDIKREIIDRGGSLRILIQDPDNAASMEILSQQLDKTHDLRHDIDGTIYTLNRMADWGRVEYGFLPYNPGFSLVVVDPYGRHGRVIVEFYGFQNELIGERMHIVIPRQQSQSWFDYWRDQYEQMWTAARKPSILQPDN